MSTQLCEKMSTCILRITQLQRSELTVTAFVLIGRGADGDIGKDLSVLDGVKRFYNDVRFFYT